MTDCKNCHDLRAAWVDAVIALDVARLASVTVDAAKHMAADVKKSLTTEAPRKRRGK